MPIIWIVFGVLMAAVPYGLFNVPKDPWPSIIAGGIGAGLFAIVLIIATMRNKVFSKKERIFSALIFIVMVTSILFSWQTSYEQSSFARSLLARIRADIGTSIFQDYTYDAMLPPFRMYCLQKPAKKIPIGDLFVKMNKSRIVNGRCIFENQEYSITYLKEVTPSGVTLISVDSVAHGRDPLFANMNGQTGRLQTKSVLTEKGVRYEREN